MSDDKITISMDEVNHATPVPGTAVPPIFTSGYVPSESDQESRPKRTGLFVGICVAAIALVCITVIGVIAVVGKGHERTVAEYRAAVIQRVHNDLSKSDSKLKKQIEDAHVTVTVTSTEILRCEVTTFDGTDKAGECDSNIDKVSMLLRFRWDGQIHKGGYTDLELVYDVQNKRQESKIVYTTAIVDEKSRPGSWFKFWYEVGSLIGTLLAL